MMNYSKPYLGKIVKVKVDRPIGSKHPKYNYLYPINYGFVPDTKAPDGEEIDAYILGVDKPIEVFTGNCIAIIHRIDDDDDKLVLCAEGQKFTNHEIIEAVSFQEKWFKSVIIR